MALEAGSSLGLPIVFLAGLASFLSPCVLPLLPGYLSYMSGISAETVRAGAVSGRRLAIPALAFVAGFTAVFVSLGASASLIGAALGSNQLLLSRIAGVLVVLMGLMFLGVIPVQWLYGEKRFNVRGKGTVGGASLMGLAFGFGWTPCIGPTLGASLLLASQEATVGRGAFYLFVYSLGLGIPFVLSALGVSRLVATMAWLRRHQRSMMRASGVLLIAFGLLMFFNKVFVISIAIQNWMRSVGLDGLVGI